MVVSLLLRAERWRGLQTHEEGNIGGSRQVGTEKVARRQKRRQLRTCRGFEQAKAVDGFFKGKSSLAYETEIPIRQAFQNNALPWVIPQQPVTTQMQMFIMKLACLAAQIKLYDDPCIGPTTKCSRFAVANPKL